MGTPVTAGFWLSPQQKYVWTLEQEGHALRSVCLFELDCIISQQALASALKQVVARHEILRTTYVHQPGMKFPFQAIVDAADQSVEYIDLSSLSGAEQEAKLDEIFGSLRAPRVGPEPLPAISATLVTLAPNHSAVLLATPAMATDVASLQIVAQELTGIVQGQPPDAATEPLRYVQFAQWQNDLIEGDEENTLKGKRFWESLRDAPEVILPHEVKSPAGCAEQVIARAIDADNLNQIGFVAKRLKASEDVILLAAWQCVLWRLLSGYSTFQVGVVFEGRDYDELRDAVGLIAKTLPIDARFDGDYRFQDVVDHVREAMAAAAEWQEYFLPGSRTGGGAAVCYEWRTSNSGTVAGSVRAAVCNDGYKLKLSVQRRSNGLHLEFLYNALQVPAESVERIAGYFSNLLTGALGAPETAVNRLPLLDNTELHRLLVEWNKTSSDYPKDECFHQLFEAQAAATPERAALRFNDELFSYRDLNERANQLAHYLRSVGVGPDSLVGLCVERSAQTIVAVLGILKAGGAYVPLNPDNPKPRLVQQLVGADALITEQKLLEQMPDFAGKTLCLDCDAAAWANAPRNNPENHSTPENLVYVIYTSGSTGVPKGVAVRHRNLVNYSHFIRRRLHVDEHTGGLHFATVSTIGADLGNTCIYPSLLSGGCLACDRLRCLHRRRPDGGLYREVPHRCAEDRSFAPRGPVAKSRRPSRCFRAKYLVMGGETFTSYVGRKRSWPAAGAAKFSITTVRPRRRWVR